MREIHESRLTFIEKVGISKGLYLCNCGNTKIIQIHSVNSGLTKSCGCLLVDFPINIKHGLRNHPLYTIWCNIKARCYNPKNTKYYCYGGRGVYMCDAWRNDFKSFYDWCTTNGWRKGLQVDKDIIGDGLLYSPKTCKIVTNKENCNKRSTTVFITINGEMKNLAQWCDFFGINRHTFYSRINTGWTTEDALTVPKQMSNKKYKKSSNEFQRASLSL